MRKKDIYIDYSKGRRRNYRSGRGKNPKNLLLVLLVIILALLLGYSAYSLAKEGHISFDFFSKEEQESQATNDEGSGNKDDTDTYKNTKDQLTKNPNDGQDDKIGEGTSEPDDKEVVDEDDGTKDNVQNQENETIESARGEPVVAKGIYVTGPVAGSADKIQELIDLVNDTELNSMVIDVKNDSGEITYKMDHDLAKEIGANTNYIPDMEQLVKDLKKEDIYLIARIVAFKDPLLAENKAELSLKNSDGSLFRDNAGLGWVNPYNKEVWEYLVEISLEAIDIGFDEIQFDYIRFSTDSGMSNVNFGPESNEKSKVDIITEFTEYAYEKLSPYAYVSADVYGAIIDSETDQQIVGQDYIQMAQHLDYICPMIYPSHYADGSYGIDYPDLEPYKLILMALSKSKQELRKIPEGTHVAKVRSWLQDFTAPWISRYQTYGPNQIREQVEGLYDAGYEEWILWNGSNNYTKGGLLQE